MEGEECDHWVLCKVMHSLRASSPFGESARGHAREARERRAPRGSLRSPYMESLLAVGYAIILFCETFTHFHCSLLERAAHNVASHADVLLAHQAILPNVHGAGTRDELVRKSAWKATYITGPKYFVYFFS